MTNLYEISSSNFLKDSPMGECEVLSIDARGPPIYFDYRYNGKTPTVPTKSSDMTLIFNTCQRYAQESDQDRGFLILLQFNRTLPSSHCLAISEITIGAPRSVGGVYKKAHHSFYVNKHKSVIHNLKSWILPCFCRNIFCKNTAVSKI